MHAYADAIRRYFNLGGRSTRSQYWLYLLTFAALMVIAAVIDGAIGNLDGDKPAIALGIVNILHLVPNLSVSVRRLHDIDRSGWWLLLSFVPVVGAVVLLVWACTGSTPGDNRFGPPQVGDDVSSAGEPALARQSPVLGNDLDRLEQLAALKASGVIDDTEFQRLKTPIIDRSK